MDVTHEFQLLGTYDSPVGSEPEISLFAKSTVADSSVRLPIWLGKMPVKVLFCSFNTDRKLARPPSSESVEGKEESEWPSSRAGEGTSRVGM